ncbi:glycoside hydrolase family 2 protein [Filimonas effusa]|uniref:Beta-galactosidase n=1 Tax=Filimonas effusa TaxID=2508721 RepID=A0A4Q1D835_9BACT|nr:glycoside hydrolase family 2 TIM barrel-domain containing protein [Filimonas effusa]RXK85484.1 beta-galactosidase [Filimonas effusa]
MRLAIIVILFLLPGAFTYSQSPGKAGLETRQRININRDWKFLHGDYPEARQLSYDDEKWNLVHLPHNFSIPYFQSTRWYTGYGWYRRHVHITEQWKNKRVSLEFEGAFREAEIFVNGQPAGSHNGGYTGFSIDITHLLTAGDNVIAVRLNNRWNARLAPRNGDHNFTGGIYRDVYLVVTNNVHVDWYGTYITTPGLSKDGGRVAIETEVSNQNKHSGVYTLKTDIVDANGKLVTSVSARQSIAATTSVVFKQLTPEVKKPRLWHPSNPYLYKAITTIWDNQKLLDSYETSFGFRWVRWTADSGFFLNGEHYYFKGANAHQDQAGWASAVTNGAIVRDVKMIKDCGMDFIRGSHYPHDPAFSAACDSLGMLLWQENDFWGSGGDQKETDNWYSGAGAFPSNKEDQPYFEESVKTNLREMIRIHRNHPSIIVWSMCNEPFFTGWGTIGRIREFLKELTTLTHQLDPSRMVAIGGCQRGEIDKTGDIAGYNGDGARLFLNPGIPSVVTEYGSTIAIRPGKYTAGWGDMTSQQDSIFPWRSGQALWCAFDYGTRASGDFGLMGMIDYFRVPKNQWYWYRNEYKHIAPPEAVKNGVPAKLQLAVDKNTINGTNGTDDVLLTVTVTDKTGRPISNSPDVTLEIVSGPGEFPTGTTIRFASNSDIYIRDGKAAITFRSYYGGKTVVKAVSEGLVADSVVIETLGTPRFVSGSTPNTTERPYVRYTIEKKTVDDRSVNIAYPKPTRASSEATGKTANLANDKDIRSCWQPNISDTASWWQVDLENVYVITEVRLQFPLQEKFDCTVDISADNQNWHAIAKPRNPFPADGKLVVPVSNATPARFLRVSFRNDPNNQVKLAEVEVFGKTADD